MGILCAIVEVSALPMSDSWRDYSLVRLCCSLGMANSDNGQDASSPPAKTPQSAVHQALVRR
jgi:hypothetical protein